MMPAIRHLAMRQHQRLQVVERERWHVSQRLIQVAKGYKNAIYEVLLCDRHARLLSDVRNGWKVCSSMTTVGISGRNVFNA